MDLEAVIGVVTVPVFALGGVAWNSLRASLEQATKDQTTETIRQLNWQKELSRELEKLRGSERQELRFVSYGQLWAKMSPLAVYTGAPLSNETMMTLSDDLSTWYFSETGGLMLTSHNRDLYFALQKLLRTVAAQPAWKAERTLKR